MNSKSTMLQIGAFVLGKSKTEKIKQIFRSRRVVRKTKNGRTLDHGFLHIPKTGGSAFSNFSREMVMAGYIMPVKFGHVWTLSSIAKSFPDTKISFMIRDPLERTVSAFNSRLRQGRPRFNRSWSQDEAIAFSLFSDVNAFLGALISKEEHDISAVHFTFRSVRHLDFNYRRYFENAKNIEQHRSSLHLVGEVENSLRFWERISGQMDIPPETAAKNFRREHVARSSSHDVLARFSGAQIEAMKTALKKEYIIYNTLKTLVNC